VNCVRRVYLCQRCAYIFSELQYSLLLNVFIFVFEIGDYPVELGVCAHFVWGAGTA
jgi:hypothetical protein